MKDYIQKIINVFTATDHSEKVTKEVHQWLVDEEHAEEKEAAVHALWDETEGKVDAGTWESLAKVYNKVGVDTEKKNEFHIRFWHYAAAVALLVVSLSGTLYLTKKQYIEVSMVENFTQSGQMRHVELPDGSIVQTNSGTILLYPEIFKGDTRTIYLIGEANFKVKKNPDQPFIVKSGTFEVTALGTEFNVAAYPENNDIVATLIHGKIRVDCDNGKNSYILNPGQQVAYSKCSGQSVMMDANIEDVTAWQRGMFVFRGDSMKEIFTVLERRFNITFQCNISHFSDDKYNFSFRKDAEIKEILDVMKEIIGGFDYKLEKDICYIKLTK